LRERADLGKRGAGIFIRVSGVLNAVDIAPKVFGGIDMKRIFFFVGMLFLATFATGCNRGTGNTSNTIEPATNRSAGNAVNASSNTAGSLGNLTNTANSNMTAGGDDNRFMMEAAAGGLAEVELGRMASTKAANAEVKQFAEMMVQDHSKANDELKSIAANKGVKIPAELDADHKAVQEDLRSKVGAEFDRAYINAMVADHKKTVALFEAESQNGNDPEIKAFATKTLPVLRKHLEAVTALDAKIK
jgi:putative membrane protein